jgi:predicted transcriptional regulator
LPAEAVDAYILIFAGKSTRMSDNAADSRLLGLTAKIVSAHVSHNAIQTDALPTLIRSVFTTLSGVGRTVAPAPALVPAVPIRKSVFADHIVCLEDGKKLKMLKRHLATAFGMTPQQYRERWGLPADYPMVAPDYADRRSALAKQIGLGRRAAEPAPARRGGRRKAVA